MRVLLFACAVAWPLSKSFDKALLSNVEGLRTNGMFMHIGAVAFFEFDIYTVYIYNCTCIQYLEEAPCET
jgi:hypothetical protein